jgi:hypothetical protein
VRPSTPIAVGHDVVGRAGWAGNDRYGLKQDELRRSAPVIVPSRYALFHMDWPLSRSSVPCQTGSNPRHDQECRRANCQFDNVGLRYGNDREILTDVSFTLFQAAYFLISERRGQSSLLSCCISRSAVAA